MKVDDIIEQLKPAALISKKDFEILVHKIEPHYSERSVYLLLNKLKNMGILKKVGRNNYLVLSDVEFKTEYSYEHSDIMKEAVQKIEMEYPLVDFQVWELIQMNEFINHLIAQNVLFIEVENMLEESVFSMLSKTYPKILLCPTDDIFFTYSEENTIVIQRLISEAPKPLSGTKSCCLEKLLVDLFSMKLSGQMIQKSEYTAIYEDAFKRYYIDEKKMFRYARRRNLEKEIKSFIKGNIKPQL